MGQLIEKGYDIHMKYLALCIRDKHKNLVTHVKMTKNRMFPLYLKIYQSRCLKEKIIDDSTLWHLRFGHLNFQGLNVLSKEKMVTRIPQIYRPIKRCEGCIIGKEKFHKRKVEKGNSSSTIGAHKYVWSN